MTKLKKATIYVAKLSTFEEYNKYSSINSQLNSATSALNKLEASRKETPFVATPDNPQDKELRDAKFKVEDLEAQFSRKPTSLKNMEKLIAGLDIAEEKVLIAEGKSRLSSRQRKFVNQL